jgi:hypothetical protein
MMDKIVVFKYEDVRRLADCINSIQVSGFENAKLISMAANIIDTGRIKNKDSMDARIARGPPR